MLEVFQAAPQLTDMLSLVEEEAVRLGGSGSGGATPRRR